MILYILLQGCDCGMAVSTSDIVEQLVGDIISCRRLDVGLIPQDLTGQIVGKERYPTSIGTFSDVWKCVYIFQRHKLVCLFTSFSLILLNVDCRLLP
jgi:hypothetical protein